MAKKITLILKSKTREDKVELPGQLWERFEQRAKGLSVSSEALVVMVLEDFVNRVQLSRLNKKRR